MDDDDYRALAEEARLAAEKASDPGERITWLRVAHEWLRRLSNYRPKFQPQPQPQQQPQQKLEPESAARKDDEPDPA
jgi:hypothetical protein